MSQPSPSAVSDAARHAVETALASRPLDPRLPAYPRHAHAPQPAPLPYQRKMTACFATRRPRRLAMLRTCVAGALAAVSLAALAQGGAPPVIDWQIQVVNDGRTVDTFEQRTTVGQTRTDTHRTPIAGCGLTGSASAAAQPEPARTVTVAPLYVDGAAITLAIDTQDTLPDSTSRDSGGCVAATRQIVASHPGLSVRADDWTDWVVAERDPRLVYRVRARVAQD
jgi:hypothetical protein